MTADSRTTGTRTTGTRTTGTGITTSSVTVLGVDGRALSDQAAARLAGATLVVGALRHLRACAVPAGARTVELGNLDRGLEEVLAHEGPSVVLASGDPGFFGVLRALRRRGVDPQVHPAVSCVARVAALAGITWDDLTVTSAHGRDLAAALNACRALPAVAVLTGPGAGPAELGAGLDGWPRELVVAERLGMPGETLTRCSATEASARSWADPNVVLCSDPTRRPDPSARWVAGVQPGPGPWALPEDAFDHRAGMVTKAEVRAVVLARLGPRLGDLVWDVGSGSASVGVESARLGAAVVAVDRDPGAATLAAANATAHDVSVRRVTGRAPEVLTDLPDPDAVFVGGGGPPVVEACARRAKRVVVVALASLDRVGPTRDGLAAAGLEVGGVQLQASRLAALPDGSSRLVGANPVLVVWGERR